MTQITSQNHSGIHIRLSRTIVGALVAFLLSLGFLPPVSAAENISGADLNTVFQARCIHCHGEGDSAEGDVDLRGLTAEKIVQDVELARRLAHVIDTGLMPPDDEPALPAETRSILTTQLQRLLHEAIEASQSEQRTPIRRMNRFQYNNAVIDLFELKCTVFTLPERVMRVHNNYFQPETGKMPEEVQVGNRPLGKSQMIEARLDGVAAFPQDLRAEHGYDNQADHLSMSPLLMDEFLKLGLTITDSPDFNPKQVGIWKRFFAPPAEDLDRKQEIRSRLQPFLTRAFRQPVDPETVARYAGYVELELERGTAFPEAMKVVAAAVLASPRFLYLYDIEQDSTQDQTTRPVNDFELASRMSFFLWGSLPDEELQNLAESGQLSQQEILDQQIDRMLRDQKLKRFCDSFPTQWLQLDRIISSVPSPQLYPDFYFSKYRLSMHMMLEPLLLFETVLIEDLPITELIDSSFTYRSAKLERGYGELGNEPGKSTGGDVTELTFQRVPVTDRRNGGVITNAAVMTMTSGTERTKPITRGAWIAAVIFNDPPKPPPADVPPLSEKPEEGDEHLTLRERLNAHRERADCRGCHEQIDPLGFALENYDAIGRWRDVDEHGQSIDASGQVFRQHEYASIIEFKDVILSEKDRFCRALAGHLLAFALARELGPSDQLAVEQIARDVAADQYKMKTMIRQVILSEPFRTKS
ncbi:MAG: DUF1592 domain-containing protein [Planctomycetaceae bacterium]|nr:DUF1592 domain-containing protein [Planctomycetaceae bacterium]